MHKYLKPLEKIFLSHADQERAASASAYLLNQFKHYGIPTPQRRSINKQYFKEKPVNSLEELTSITKSCFEHTHREFHHTGIELFAFYKNLWDENVLSTIEYGLLHRSWWDSVDTIASDWIHPYFKLYPKQILPVTSTWNKSKNLWLQRSSIMFQKRMKKDTDTVLLAKYILNCSKSNEFFIQKAIGWALREYGKTNPIWVRQFVQQHALSPLSKREALKNI